MMIYPVAHAAARFVPQAALQGIGLLDELVRGRGTMRTGLGFDEPHPGAEGQANA